MTIVAPSAVETFRALVARRLGLNFDERRRDFLAEVLQRRVDATSSPGAEAYLDRFASGAGADELRTLADPLTVGETFFFRDPDHFRALSEVALPEHARQRRIRILSAGCATGEEPYSIAMLIRERMPDLDPRDVSILAVDLNPVSLGKAAQGRYSTWSLRATSDAMRDRYFRADGRDFVLSPDIRSMITFDERNLSVDDPSYWGSLRCDVIFCRNVVMYFTPEVMREVIHRLSTALVQGGYLFLGHAETLRGVSQEFHLRHTHDTFYYQRKDAVGEPVSVPRPSVERPETSWSTSWIETIQRSTDRIQELSERPAAVAPAPSPPVPRARANIGVVLELFEGERHAEALQLLATFAPESSQDPDVLLLHAVLLTHGGEIGAAERVCARLLVLDEHSAGAHYVLALCREAVRDMNGAADHDRVAAYLDPTFGMPRLHLGLMANRAGDRDGAVRELGQAALLLHREDASRLLLFGGGFSREALVALCRSEITSAGGRT